MKSEVQQSSFLKFPVHFLCLPTGSYPMYSLVLLSALSGVLLALPYLFAEAYLLAWFALVPILVAIEKLPRGKNNLRKVYFLAVVFGLVYYVCAAYWIIDFIILFKAYSGLKGFIISVGFWLYCAQLPALVFTCLVWLRGRGLVHDFFLFPVLVITFYSAFPGIQMSQLGESQSQFLVAIQATEFVGVQGLNGLIALVNIFLSHVVLAKSRKIPCVVAAIVVLFWFFYGFYSVASWQDKIAKWDTLRIGFVQGNDAPSVDAVNTHLGYSRAFPQEMEMTERLVSAGAELVVWPEARYKNYFDSRDVRNSYHRSVKQMQSHLIFQDIENVQSPQGAKRYNAVAHIDREGNQAAPYRKNIRIAFGEYMPEFRAAPFLSGWFRSILGDFNSEISPGNGHHYFDVDGTTIIPLVCYETLFPAFVAEAVSDRGKGSILLALSNDAWFGETAQAYQHLNASTLRAVENRLPFIFALNSGPSLVVMPSGEVSFQTDAFRAGGYLTDMPYSKKSGGSFFSRHPYLFLYVIYSFSGLIFFISIMKNLGLTFQERLGKR